LSFTIVAAVNSCRLDSEPNQSVSQLPCGHLTPLSHFLVRNCKSKFKSVYSVKIKDVNRKSGSISLKTGFELILLSFSSRKLHKSNQMSHKINSHICLMLSVYKMFSLNGQK